MELNWYLLALVPGEYATVAVLVVVVVVLTAVMLALAHLIGPRRHGPVKDATYESGLEPLTDARRRFNVRYYLVAVMYVVFGVEVAFLYPWAVMFPQQRTGLTEYHAAEAAGAEAVARVSQTARWANHLAESGYGPGFTFGAILVFFALLAVGFVYEWRRGLFKWD